MAYEKIGAIEDISDIQLNTPIIVNGSVDRTGWMWHMGGMFKKKGNEIVFENDYGMTTKVERGKVSLTTLRKTNRAR